MLLGANRQIHAPSPKPFTTNQYFSVEMSGKATETNEIKRVVQVVTNNT